MTAYRRGIWVARRNAALNGTGTAAWFLEGLVVGMVVVLAIWWGLDDPAPQGAACCDAERWQTARGGAECAEWERWEVLP